jgi:hypothetical protein
MACIDGEFAGTAGLIRYGNVPLMAQDALHVPWWWVRIMMMEERIKNIQSNAASDPEKLVAPKELWLTGKDDELEAWFDEREARRDELTRQKQLERETLR